MRKDFHSIRLINKNHWGRRTSIDFRRLQEGSRTSIDCRKDKQRTNENISSHWHFDLFRFDDRRVEIVDLI